MLESITFRCRPGAQFHFGKIALDADTSLDDTSAVMRSDTLASGFVDTAYRVLDGKIADQVLADFENGTVRVSSLLWQMDLPNGRQVHFLPKPVSFDARAFPPEPLEGKAKTDRKATLRASFISKGVWEAGLQPQDWADKCFVLQREFVLLREEAAGIDEDMAEKLKLYHTVSLPKVAVHKLTRENSLYHQTNVQIANPADYGLEGAGVHFYFLLESDNNTAANRVKNLARIMADEGIGGERSVGCGQLENVEKAQEFKLSPAQHSKNLFCSASLISPASQEELDEFQAWKVVTRGGRRTAGDGPLKRLKMLAEGAVLRNRVKGATHVISLKEAQYAYRRFGSALCLPAHDHHELIFTTV